MEDLLFNPTLAAELLLGFKLDTFQSCRLKTFWWTPYVIDSSGFSTGKTAINWVFAQLRALLLPGSRTLVYYQTFQVMKNTFWGYYNDCTHPMYMAQVGQLSKTGEDAAHGKDTKKEPACYKAFFRNGSEIWHPAPGFKDASRTQASQRTNTLIVDEFTKAETMAKNASGIDDQLLGRVTQRSFNKLHPIWCNHMLFTGTAENKDHPSYARLKSFEKAIKRGSPNHAVVSFSFKDFSDAKMDTGETFKDAFRVDETIQEMKRKFTRTKYLQEVLGKWTRDGTGLYGDGVYQTCEQMWKMNHCKYLTHRHQDENKNAHYFLGVDSAPAQSNTADDGSLLILRAVKKPETEGKTYMDFDLSTVWAMRVRGATTRQWSGLIHKLHLVWRFDKICLDHGAGGGGGFIANDLSKDRQLIDGKDEYCMPIITPYNQVVVDGEFCLVMFSHGDKMIQQVWPDVSRGYDLLKDYAHQALHTAMYHSQLALPERRSEHVSLQKFSDEVTEIHSLLSEELPKQLSTVTIQTTDDGATRLLTAQGARRFLTKGRDDFVSALIHTITGFRVWCFMAEAFESDSDEDELCCGASAVISD